MRARALRSGSYCLLNGLNEVSDRFLRLVLLLPSKTAVEISVKALETGKRATESNRFIEIRDSLVKVTLRGPYLTAVGEGENPARYQKCCG